MKRVVSVSLGSSERNHTAEAEFLGEKFLLERVGTDGDYQRALDLVRELDGKVDAITIGGTPLYLSLGNRHYYVAATRKLVEAAEKTPVVSGSGLKDILEARAVDFLFKQGVLRPGMTFLITSVVDRWGMTEAIVRNGGKIIVGDFMFALHMNIPIRSLATVKAIGSVVLPLALKLPFSMLYPQGEEQTKREPLFPQYFFEADVIAGDYLYIHKYMPDRLDGKIILTNTVTPKNVEDVRDRGAKALIATTPEINGRNFGTNVLAGVFTALLGHPGTPPDYPEYAQLIDQLDLKPSIRLMEGD
ncbi:quinate 5-dehydrogenase [Coprothermobacteraceae bacterium]|nr:quinate 5-dehydrogenase [Coprothermobacteraceae bacterium]